jgi:hypothetical protein
MQLNIYDYKILSPAKCGSRYLDMIYDTENSSNGKGIIPKGSKFDVNSIYQIKKVINSSYSDKLFDVIEWKEIEWIVIRPPMELTISAIHTDFMMCWNKKHANESQMNEEELASFFSKSNSGHYHSELYRNLCFNWMKTGKIIKFIHLNNLSSFCEEMLNEKITKNKDTSFNENQFNFSNWDVWFKKEDIFEYFKKVYPTYWDDIKRNLIKETFFWEKLVKEAEFYKPKLSIEDTKIFS